MATIDLGKIRLNWRGTYVSTTTYEYNDAVYYQNSSYVYINTNSSSGNTPQATGSYWQILADGTTELTTRGDLLIRGASSNERLPAGTSGYYLQTKGTSANPVWAEGSRPADLPRFGLLPYTWTSSLVPQTKGSALSASYDGSNNTFTVTGHGFHNGARIRFVGTSNMTTNSNFAVDYTYYVANKTTDTFQLSKTFTFGSTPAAGAVVTGSTSVSSVTNMYNVKPIADNWLGWDETTETSLIEGGVATGNKLGPQMQNYSTGAKYVYYWIDKDHNLWCSGRQGQAYSGNYNESDSTASAGWTIPVDPENGGLREGEHFVQVGSMGGHAWWARTNKGALFTWGVSSYMNLGHGDDSTRSIPHRVKYFDDNDLIVVGAVGSSMQYSDSGYGYPTMYVVCAKRGSGLDSDGRPNHERRELYSFGYNGNGQMGIGNTTNTNIPTKVLNLPNSVMQVAVGCGHQNFIMVVCEETESSQEDGNMRLWTFGRNEHGYGAGTMSETKSSPFKHTGSDFAKTAWITVWSGDWDNGNGDFSADSFFIDTAGRCFHTGRNAYGLGGHGHGSNVATWNHTNGTIGFREVYSTEHTSCALQGVPGTGHHGQTFGAWGAETSMYLAGYNGHYQVNHANTTESNSWREYDGTTTEGAFSIGNGPSDQSASISFPNDRIVHASPEMVGNTGTVWAIDTNSILWVWGNDDDYDWHDSSSGTTIQFPRPVIKPFSQRLDYTANQHNLGPEGRYIAFLKTSHAYSSRSTVHAYTNDGKRYSMGHNTYEANNKAQQGDTRSLGEWTNDVS